MCATWKGEAVCRLTRGDCSTGREGAGYFIRRYEALREFLKRLLGLKPDLPLLPAAGTAPAHSSADGLTTTGGALPNRGGGGKAVVDRYFELATIIERAKAEGAFPRAIRAARETYPLLPAVVRQMQKEYGRFDISTSHAVHTASSLMAVMSDREAIQDLRGVLTTTQELRDWLPVAEDAERDLIAVNEIVEAVAANPGLVQSDLKNHCGLKDGRRLSTLAAWLEKAARMRRVRDGSTYRLYPSGARTVNQSAEAPAAGAGTLPTGSAMTPARRSRRGPAARARHLDLKGLPIVRLPMAPHHGGQREQGEAAVVANSQQNKRSRPSFSVEGDGWTLRGEGKLPAAERPDLAFKQMFPTAGSTLWLDPRGRRAPFPEASAIALTTDRTGTKLAECGLAHDVYRADINGDGSGVLFLSKEGVLHGYTERLEAFILERVADLPEYAAQANRFGIQGHELKNHTRCVALSTDRSRYLVAIVDEAWCYDAATGNPLWGLRFPAKHGWTEVTGQRSQAAGSTAEIDAALRFMELSLPVDPDSITRRYRALAMRWHPDRNPNDPGATQKFQELNAAMELLGGTDVSSISVADVEHVSYEKLLHQSPIVVAGGGRFSLSIGLSAGGAFGADWVYAANFARTGHSVFLAGYSGNVVEVDASGKPHRVYDIGAVPRQVGEVSAHRYVLTDTRLYVLRQDSLEAIVDVLDQARLIVGDAGIGLLEPKRLQWFTLAGHLVGCVETRDPIRRAYSAPTGLVIETRTHRAVVEGAPSWW